MADNSDSYLPAGAPDRRVGGSAKRRFGSVISFVEISLSLAPFRKALPPQRPIPPIVLPGPASKCDREQAEGMRPLLGVQRVCYHDLLPAPILSRRKRADELQFVLSRDKLFIPGRSRVLFDRRSLLGFGGNVWPGRKLLSQSAPGSHRETGANSNQKISHKNPRFTALIPLQLH
jgi:hypothetical protein